MHCNDLYSLKILILVKFYSTLIYINIYGQESAREIIIPRKFANTIQWLDLAKLSHFKCLKSYLEDLEDLEDLIDLEDFEDLVDLVDFEDFMDLEEPLEEEVVELESLDEEVVELELEEKVELARSASMTSSDTSASATMMLPLPNGVPVSSKLWDVSVTIVLPLSNGVPVSSKLWDASVAAVFPLSNGVPVSSKL